MTSAKTLGPLQGSGGLRATLLGASALVLCGPLWATPLLADPLLTASRNSYGMPGLIDMPTAGMRTDGELGMVVTGITGGTMRSSLTFQIAPRLLGAFRYSRVPGLMPDGAGGYEPLFDRSFDIRWQMLEEGRLTPAIAVGLNDFVGTSIYSGEYIVATKGFGDALQVSAGLGWGRLGSSGAIATLGTRPAYDFTSTGGQFNTGSWFRGDVAPFFGLAWALNDRVTLKAEYSSDAYTEETRLDEFDRRTSINLGVDYKISDSTNLQLFALHGDRVGFQFSRSLDPKVARFPSGTEKTPLPVRSRPPVSADPDGWSGAWSADPTAEPALRKVLADALIDDGQLLESMSLSTSRAELRVRNETYSAQPQAIGRIARIATRALPSSVETITVTSVEKGMPVSSVTFRRADLEALENTRSDAILSRASITDAARDPAQITAEGLYPRFQWSLKPYVEMSYFDPNSPLRIDLGMSLRTRLELGSGFYFASDLRQRVVGNLNESSRASNSVVQHVRSDTAEYQRAGGVTVRTLSFSHLGRPAPNLYSRFSAGYLERMFGGVSGEVLWKPVDSRLALGLEANWVKQRDFDQRFGFQDYSVATGHVSAYYDFGKGYLGQVDVGRYLAKDWGATVSLDREFANGWRVGAFATITDMSREDFGEGSFDKGIRIVVPVSAIVGKPTKTVMSTTLRPLTRDGGARLNLDDRLYETVRGDHVGALYEDWGRFWR